MTTADSALYELVYDGETNPDKLQFTKYGLVTGELYKFRVYSINFNGLSIPSVEKEIYACGLPLKFSRPTFVTSTQSSITIKWDPPRETGGCPILDYEI